MVQDWSYLEYRCSVYERINEDVAAKTMNSSGRYEFHVRDREASVSATPYCGYTILAEPYPTPDLRVELAPIITRLAESVSGFVPVDLNTLHLTIADLVSKDRHDTLERRGQQHSFVGRIRQLLEPWQCEPALRGTVLGIGGFPATVVAFVDFENTDDYARLVELRNVIYDDSILACMGVRRAFPFQAHITLGYLESVPPENLDGTIATSGNSTSSAGPCRSAARSCFIFPTWMRTNA